jgi:hypothetical protein
MVGKVRKTKLRPPRLLKDSKGYYLKNGRRKKRVNNPDNLSYKQLVALLLKHLLVKKRKGVNPRQPRGLKGAKSLSKFAELEESNRNQSVKDVKNAAYFQDLRRKEAEEKTKKEKELVDAEKDGLRQQEAKLQREILLNLLPNRQGLIPAVESGKRRIVSSQTDVKEIEALQERNRQAQLLSRQLQAQLRHLSEEKNESKAELERRRQDLKNITESNELLKKEGKRLARAHAEAIKRQPFILRLANAREFGDTRPFSKLFPTRTPVDEIRTKLIPEIIPTDEMENLMKIKASDRFRDEVFKSTQKNLLKKQKLRKENDEKKRKTTSKPQTGLLDMAKNVFNLTKSPSKSEAVVEPLGKAEGDPSVAPSAINLSLPPTHKLTRRNLDESVSEGEPMGEVEDEDDDNPPSTTDKKVPPEEVDGSGRDKNSVGLRSGELNDLMMQTKAGKYFRGVCASDEITKLHFPPNQKLHCFIMNLDKHDKPGSHWVACALDLKDRKEVCYFDPLADPAPKSFAEQMKVVIDNLKPSTYLKFKENMIRRQSNTSDTCGWMCMLFLNEYIRGSRWKFCTGYTELKEKEIEKMKGQFGYGFI